MYLIQIVNLYCVSQIGCKRALAEFSKNEWQKMYLFLIRKNLKSSEWLVTHNLFSCFDRV